MVKSVGKTFRDSQVFFESGADMTQSKVVSIEVDGGAGPGRGKAGSQPMRACACVAVQSLPGLLGHGSR